MISGQNWFSNKPNAQESMESLHGNDKYIFLFRFAGKTVLPIKCHFSNPRHITIRKTWIFWQFIRSLARFWFGTSYHYNLP